MFVPYYSRNVNSTSTKIIKIFKPRNTYEEAVFDLNAYLLDERNGMEDMFYVYQFLRQENYLEMFFDDFNMDREFHYYGIETLEDFEQLSHIFLDSPKLIEYITAPMYDTVGIEKLNS
jgi:hypothetical protein